MSGANTDIDEVVFSCVEQRVRRVLHSAVRGLLVGLLTWVGTLLFLQLFLLPNWAPPQRAQLATAVAIPIGILWAVAFFCTRAFGVTLCSNSIAIHRQLSPQGFQIDELLAAVGICGIDISGGELLTWKRLTLLTSTRSHTLSFTPALNSQIYDVLVESCPNCVGIPYPPTQIAYADRMYSALPLIASHLRRSASRKLVWGLGVVLPIAMIVVIAVQRNMAQDVARGAAPICIGAIAGLYFIVSAVREVALIRKLRRINA